MSQRSWSTWNSWCPSANTERLELGCLEQLVVSAAAWRLAPKMELTATALVVDHETFFQIAHKPFAPLICWCIQVFSLTCHCLSAVSQTSDYLVTFRFSQPVSLCYSSSGLVFLIAQKIRFLIFLSTFHADFSVLLGEDKLCTIVIHCLNNCQHSYMTARRGGGK